MVETGMTAPVARGAPIALQAAMVGALWIAWEALARSGLFFEGVVPSSLKVGRALVAILLVSITLGSANAPGLAGSLLSVVGASVATVIAATAAFLFAFAMQVSARLQGNLAKWASSGSPARARLPATLAMAGRRVRAVFATAPLLPDCWAGG